MIGGRRPADCGLLISDCGLESRGAAEDRCWLQASVVSGLSVAEENSCQFPVEICGNRRNLRMKLVVRCWLPLD